MRLQVVRSAPIDCSLYWDRPAGMQMPDRKAYLEMLRDKLAQHGSGRTSHEAALDGNSNAAWSDQWHEEHPTRLPGLPHVDVGLRPSRKAV